MDSVQRHPQRRRGLVVRFLLAAVVALVPAATLGPAQAAAPDGGNALGAVIEGSYVVTLYSGEPAAVAAEHARLGARVGDVLTTALTGYTARMAEGVAAAVAADPRVRSVIADRAVSVTAQSTPSGITRVGAADASVRSGDGAGTVDADIAIVDTGIDLDHPDLTVAGGVDCVDGGDSFDDPRGHGTHMAGIAAARDNDIGVVGVAPGARVWAVRVLDGNGNGSLTTLLCGIEWVTRNADTIEVANMSLTGRDAALLGGAPDRDCRDGGLHEAICASVAAGVTYTVAAGNNAADARFYSPAAYPQVITVSALADFDGLAGALAAAPSSCPGGDDDEFAVFSNFGAPVDLLAPGVCIRSTWQDGSYATLTGSSQSAAHVAGGAAIYLADNPGATPAAVREALIGAGSASWLTDTDPDGTPEPLLDVSSF